MRGPSSSHTAASYHIGRLVATLLGSPPVSVQVSFDPGGSYGQVYRQQGVDRGFAMGIMGVPLTDPGFFRALETLAARGVQMAFGVRPLAGADHPNAVDIRLEDAHGRSLEVRACSTGGGAVEITRLDGWPVLITGQAFEVLVEMPGPPDVRVPAILASDGHWLSEPVVLARECRSLVHGKRRRALSPETRAVIAALQPGGRVLETPPLAHIKQGPPLFASAAEMLALADARACSLGRLALAHESTLLGIAEQDIFEEMTRRVDLMRAAVREGLGENLSPLQLLTPTAGLITRAESEGRLPVGGLHTRAAARALAVMHINSGMGVVCAAPTGGSAGVLPAVLATLIEERGLERDQATFAALAAGAVGVIVGARATFAAEVAGCQVEIGAAGAMASAAVVEAGAGTPRQAADAAAIAFQNTMGSVCDLVQGIVEIPCHTRNAVAASSAFVCADLVMGGYLNPIPLDETIDAVLAVGRMLPPELRVTSRGGLAMAPSARKLRPRQ